MGEELIKKRFKLFKKENKIAIIPYITAFDPHKRSTIEFLKYIAEAEPLCIELGFPFSDPVADGPIIQKAMVRALKNSPTLEEYFELISYFKSLYPQIPLLCMTYYNIIYRYGLINCVNAAISAKLDGFIIPDLPLEEAKPWLNCTKKTSLATVFLAAPTSSESRIKKLSKLTRGFLYYVSLTGVTGIREILPSDLKERLIFLKSLVKKPIAVGFGISKPEQVKALSPFVDALVVGSALVKIIEDKKEKAGKDLLNFLNTLKNESH
ncbi:MAG: tryptophan synthase subunit alpha [Thermodesulfobacteriaceae bacterium]|nr:tryptophan synthase subunit alpha [Thermodesulfobacteriaceae bacterium]